jgi:hypothetical protein
MMVKNDIIEGMKQFYEPSKLPFKGSIGTWKYTGSLTPQQNYTGIRLMAADVDSGVIRIKNIRTSFDEDLAPFEIYIYDNNNNLVETVLVFAEKDKLTSNIVDIELPLHYDYLDNVKYYFMYDSTGKHPKNIGSGCIWDVLKPCFTKYKKGWESWVMVSGYSKDDLTDFTDHQTYSGDICTLNGIILDVEIICKMEEVICEDGFDFVSNPLAMSIAYATRFKAGINVIESMLGDSEFNRLLMANRESLINFRSLFIENYQKKIAYIAENIDVSNSDCFTCLDNWGFKKQTIYS